MIIGMADKAEKAARISAKAMKKKAAEEGVPLLETVTAFSSAKQVASGKRFNLRSVADVLIDAGLNPAEEILRVMPQLDADVKARLFAELLQYVQPKLKSIEVTGNKDKPLEVVQQMPNEQIAKIAQGFLAATK